MPWDGPIVMDTSRDENRGFAKRDDIVAYTNDFLDLPKFKDYGPMGLQFKGKENVERIACGVSMSQDLIDAAIEYQADMLIVHHGLFWNNEPHYLDKRMIGRLDTLGAANINVLAYHLALDAHPVLGNNVLALRDFQGKVRRFGDIGYGKKLDRPIKRYFLDDYIADWNPETICYPDGPTQIRKVAAVVGGAPFYIHDAVREGYDLFITGEAAEPSQALAAELGINFVALGHYNSEKSGVKALTEKIATGFNLKWKFLDIPNAV